MIEKLKLEMIKYYSGDPKRIQHFIKVYFFCEIIGKEENLSEYDMLVLKAAALTHDIGIKRAEELFGSSNGKFQESLGPSVAKDMLEKIGFEKSVIERVCFLIAHHHTYSCIKGIDYRILVESDFLVNLYEDNSSEESILSAKDKIFRTKTGIKLFEEIFAV